MDKIIIAALLGVAAILLVVELVLDIVEYYRRQRLLRELVAAALKGDVDADVEDEVLEAVIRESEKQSDEEDACLTCKHCEECEPLDKAHAFEDGCERWDEK